MKSQAGATLLVVYHRPFWRGEDGSLWEREGAFSRYIEALAPHFGRILLAVPLATGQAEEGHRLQVGNVELAALPFFDGLPRFFRVFPSVVLALWRGMARADLVNLRLPTPAGSLAFILARLRRLPVFLLVVGDLAAVAESVPRDTTKGRIYRLYVALEELCLQWMAGCCLTVTNGRALYEKHFRPGRRVFETRNSTVRVADIARARQAYQPPRARLLCVSRIEPRKGVRYLPQTLAFLRELGMDVSLRVIGPTVGGLGRDEKNAAIERARRVGVGERLFFDGAASIEQVYAAYTEHDLLLVPSLPGEGIPRVLIEAMAAGLPVVATSVAGIPDLVHDGQNGLVVAPADGQALAEAAARLLQDQDLRGACIENGYATAREHTIEAQTSWLANLIAQELRPSLPLGEHKTPFPTAVGEGRGEGDPPRITIPLAGLNLSGGVKSLLLLANELVRRGARVRLIVPSYAAEPPVPLDSRVELQVLATSGPGWLRRPFYFLRLAGRAAQAADVVLANYFLTVYPTYISWLLHGRRAALAYNVRGYEPWSHGSMASTGTVGRYLRFLLACQSYRLPFKKLVTTDWLQGMVGDERATVVGHGIDLEIFQPEGRKAASRQAECVVGAIGREGAVKGYSDFLAASGRLHPRGRVRYLVVRADPVPLPTASPAEAAVARTEAEMAEFYRRCDIFVFPSLAEGFGLPGLEAMACGCAVVTTDCGGVSAFAEPDQNCLMVPPGRPQLLAEAIAKLVDEPGLRARLALRGLHTARGFERAASLQRLADAVLALSKRPRDTTSSVTST